MTEFGDHAVNIQAGILRSNRVLLKGGTGYLVAEWN